MKRGPARARCALSFAIIVASATGALTLAGAQTSQPPAVPRPDMPSPQTRPTMPVPPASPRGDESLSQSPGVIRPPAVGDGGVMTPPNTDKTPMPVIPPPGTPGGNPNVRPQ